MKVTWYGTCFLNKDHCGGEWKMGRRLIDYKPGDHQAGAYQQSPKTSKSELNQRHGRGSGQTQMDSKTIAAKDPWMAFVILPLASCGILGQSSFQLSAQY